MPLKQFYRFLPLFTLLIGTLIAIFIGFFTYNYYEQKEHERLEIASHEIVLLIRARMATYEQVLRSGVAFFDNSDHVTRERWAQYVKEQKLDENFKGIQGFGYNEIVLAKDFQAHESEIRKEGLSNYAIKPTGQRDIYVPIIYLEPNNARNQKAIGYDVFSEKIRKDAMIKAMQSGKAVITGKITLVQENDKDIQAGFIMYLPLYKKGAKIDTAIERTVAIQGFISAPFRANDLMKGILGTRFPNIDFVIYDGQHTLDENFLYYSSTDIKAEKKYKTINITMNDHTWTIAFRTNKLLAVSNLFIVILVPLLILSLTLLLYLFLRLWIKTDINLLKVMQNRYISMFKEHDSIMLLIDSKDGSIVDANESAQEFYGYTHEEFLSLHIGDINQLSHQELALLMPQTVQRKQNHFIFQHKLKSGELRTIEVFGSPIKTENSKLIFSIIRDITKEKEIEAKLNELRIQTETDRQRYEAFMKYASNGVFIMDMQGNLKECSQMAARMLGYTMEEMKMLNVIDWEFLIPADEIQKLFESTSTQEPIHFESQHKRKDGSIYDASISSIKILLNGEALVYASVRDITKEKELLTQIKKEELRKELALSTGTVGIWEWNMDANTLIWDSVMYEIYGITQKDGVSPYEMWSNTIDPDDKPAVEASLFFAKENNIDYNISFWIKTSSGERKYIHAIGKYEFDESGRAYKMVGINNDITNLKNQAELIRKQNAEFKTIFDISRDGLAILDLESNFLDFNDAYLNMTGFTKEELLATSCVTLSSPEDHDKAIQALQIVLENGYIESFEKTCIVKNNKHIITRMAISLMPDKERIMISAKDITDIRNHEHQLEFIAHFDPLTKLPNRVLLSDRMQQSIANTHRSHQKLAIAYLDLDGFKQVNDTYGHDAGDKLLIELSKRMHNILREGDTLARLGGDEFVAILGNQNDESETFSILNRLLDAASSTVDIKTAVVSVSASIGVTFFSNENRVDADILLRQADQAMYEAKLHGKNQIAVFEGIAESL